MALTSGSEVFHSIIIHRDRGIPIQLAERFVNPTLAPEYLSQDFTRITPSAYLLKVASVTEVEHIVETSMPDKQMRKYLQIQASEPCLVLHRTTWFKEVVVTRNRFIYPGSRYSIGGRFKTSGKAHNITA
jgi:GntR family histidine utilization transcriptional repressor